MEFLCNPSILTISPCLWYALLWGDSMATDAQNRANRKYKAKAYDRLELQLKRGMKEEYREQAAAHGMSLNAYIVSLLEADKAIAKPAPPPDGE